MIYEFLTISVLTTIKSQHYDG